MSRALLAFLGVDLALSLLLGYRLVAPSPVTVVPGIPSEQVLMPGEVPDETLARFALFFALNFETYATSTMESQDRFSLALVSPRFLHAFEKISVERKSMVREARLASSIYPDLRTLRVEKSAVLFRAKKQQVIGDRLSWEAVFDYRIDIERAFPTNSNPHGLAVAGFSASKAEESRDR